MQIKPSKLACLRKRHYDTKHDAKLAYRRALSRNLDPDNEVYRCVCGLWCIGRPSPSQLRLREIVKRRTGTTKPGE
jgi:hypothetical protein